MSENKKKKGMKAPDVSFGETYTPEVVPTARKCLPSCPLFPTRARIQRIYPTGGDAGQLRRDSYLEMAQHR